MYSVMKKISPIAIIVNMVNKMKFEVTSYRRQKIYVDVNRCNRR